MILQTRNNVYTGELDVYLKCISRIRPSVFNGNVRSMEYDIIRCSDEVKVGICDIRLSDGYNEELYYSGNIGYRIYEYYRGNGYAYQACLILFDILKKEYNRENIIITCSPDNIPSKVTLEKLGGELIEECEVPKDHYLYRRGETIKRIYKYKL